MAYIITKTNGDALVTVPDTEKNTDYGVTLVGRNYSGYGVFLNDNFVALMENFASTSAPATPLSGQLWFNTTTKNLSVWEGTAWKVLSSITSSDTTPGSAGTKVGDFWFDSTNYQLKIWTGSTTFARNVTASSTGNVITITSSSGLLVDDVVTHANVSALNDVRISQILNSSQLRLSANVTVSSSDAISFVRGNGWYTVGPAYTRGQKINGILPTTVVDTLGVSHTVGLIYVDGSIQGTISKDLEYTPNTATAIAGFSTIKPGIQLKSSDSIQITKTVQSFSVGSSGQTLIQLTSNQDLLIGDRYSSANVSIGAGTVISALYPNNAVVVNTTTTVYANEDIIFQRGTDVVSLFNGTSTNSQQLNNKSSDLYAQLDSYANFQTDVAINGNLEINGNTRLLASHGNLTIRNIISQSNISFVSNVPALGSTTTVLNISGVDGLLTVRADPTVNLGVATKQYVDTTKDLINGFIASNVSALINSAPASRQNFGNISNIIDDVYSNLATLTSGINIRATIDNPAFTGVPTAPTAASETSNTQIATTAFTTTAVNTLATNLNANISAANAQIVLKAAIASPTFTGTPLVPNAAPGANSGQIASTAWVNSTVANINLATYAPLSNPTFTNTPAAPTANISANTTQLATTAFVHTLLPAGTIILWYGSQASIPYGWALCNGSNGTPDLRNRFIIGAGNTYEPGAIGGSAANTATTASNGTHSHTGLTGNTALSIDQMPNHTHSGSATVVTVSGSGVSVHNASNQRGSTTLTVANTGGGQGHDHTISSDGAHTHSVVVSTLPPYHALCYIMKVV